MRHFSILTRPHLSSDALPTRVAHGLARASSAFGLNIGGAQEAQPSSGVTAWLVPGSTGDCVVAETAPDTYGVACGHLATGADSEISVLAGGMVVGFVPNGSAAVSATTPGGQTISANVVNNAYAFPAPNASSAMFKYANAAGTQTEPLVFPTTRPAAG